MKRILLTLLACSSSLFANLEDLGSEDEDDVQEAASMRATDVDALKKWVLSKQQVGLKSQGGSLSISGEVRTEMQKTSEVVNDVRQRGAGGAVSGASTYGYDVEVNLMFTYRNDNTWANIKIEMDENAGVVGGTTNRIALERAFFGVRLFEVGVGTGTIELGRRKLGYTFDSKVQFASYMDGIVAKLTAAFDYAGEFYAIGGPFLVNEQKDQYAYVAELGVLNLCNTGIYLKYSIIDWDTKQFENPLLQMQYRYCNSQLTLGYKIVPPWVEKVLTVYAAGLINTAAKGVAVTHYHKDNYAWYIGFSIGEARRKGDWSLDVNYQLVAPQAVPQFDSGGIGSGNAANRGFYYNTFAGKLVPTTSSTARGDTNFKGISMDLLYMFTDSLTLQQSWMQSVRQNHSVGVPFHYKQYEMELIYTF